MSKKETKEEFVELFEDLAILKLILMKNLFSASELKEELEKTIELSQRTIYRRLDKFVSNGIVVRKSNNGKKKVLNLFMKVRQN